MNSINFEDLARRLLSRSEALVSSWLPSGKRVGNEWKVGSIHGEAGSSLSINLRTGMWADFAAGQKGGDLTSLYAAINSLSQIEAASQLLSQVGDAPLIDIKIDLKDEDVIAPPVDAPIPAFANPNKGSLVGAWIYKSIDGSILFYVARYDTAQGAKEFTPFTWSKSLNRWTKKAWPEPRPLYGIERLISGNEVLIVEGEKCVEALRSLSPLISVVTWCGGSQAVNKTDWRPLHGRPITIWPDADSAGIRAANAIKKILPHAKILDVASQPDGWDAADAIADGWDVERIKEWMDRSSLEEIQGAPMSRSVIWNCLGLDLDRFGNPICNMMNGIRILENWKELSGFLWYDEFHRQIFTKQDGVVRSWEDSDDCRLLALIQGQLGIYKMNIEASRHAVIAYCYKNVRNEPKEWMESLQWDGISRIERCFIDLFGADESNYCKTVSKNFWISMTARIMRPGCKVDNMVILEGGQGKYKSSALNVIGGKWYSEATEQVGTKDFYQSLGGFITIEISELDAFGKAQINTIKRVLSSQVDVYRPSYGRYAKSFPRQCVFIGTTNEDVYLRDSTGGRRFWPIKVGEINLEVLKTQRNQLFAEAVSLFKSGATWYEVPQEEAEMEQEKRRIEDPWEGLIAKWLSGRRNVTIDEVASQALVIDNDKRTAFTDSRIRATLKLLGWTSGHNVRRKDNIKKGWKPIYSDESSDLTASESDLIDSDSVFPNSSIAP